MPELPEVETVLQGIEPCVENKFIRAIIVRQSKLRWEIPKNIQQHLVNQKVIKLSRRGKYLLFHLKVGTLILHFGMSGSLKILTTNKPPTTHDHFDLIFDNFYLRYTDPRRFGSLLFTEEDPEHHPLLASMGPEPLSNAFNERYLFKKAKNRKVGVKQFIMNHKIVVGVGNIYAAESLFLAGIHPLTPVSEITEARFEKLTKAIKKVLQSAIKKGGTTLKDFRNSEGKAGYFQQKLNVYGRANEPCLECQQLLQDIRIQNRATVFCPKCQPL